MLAIRLRRQGRKNHAHYRMIVQDSRRHPTNGKVVAYLGTYDPYTKQTKLDTNSAKSYLTNGAQPSPRAAKLLKESGVKLPSWVEAPKKANKTAKHPEKLRKNQPKDAPAPVAEAQVEETPTEAATEETKTEAIATEKPEAKAEAPADEAKETPVDSDKS